jgi:lantibiotic modifying enzyme
LIWTRLALAAWGMDRGDGLARACALADGMPEAMAAGDATDVLSGAAGAIAPLLALARMGGGSRYLAMASDLGDRLCTQARSTARGAFWVHENWPQGIGGFAHGVTGIGWSLTRLARATGESGYGATAQAAFAFEESLYDPAERNWLDLRMLEGAKTAAAWCHGAVGIGLAHLDLDPQLRHPSTRSLLRRACAATWRQGLGWNHSACHGDASAWELIDAAIAAGEGPAGLSREALLAGWLTSLEDHGAVCGMARESFSPGLMPGVGGIAYQLLRAHPQSDLPSILTPGGERF